MNGATKPPQNIHMFCLFNSSILKLHFFFMIHDLKMRALADFTLIYSMIMEKKKTNGIKNHNFILHLFIQSN